MKWARGVSLALLSTLAVTGTAAAQAPQVRMKWQDFVAGPDGAKRLASLQAATNRTRRLIRSIAAEGADDTAPERARRRALHARRADEEASE